VQRLLQVQLRNLCPNLSSHFALVAQLEASAGIMAHLQDDNSNHDHRQHLIVTPESDSCPWALVRARSTPSFFDIMLAFFSISNHCASSVVLCHRGDFLFQVHYLQSALQCCHPLTSIFSILHEHPFMLYFAYAYIAPAQPALQVSNSDLFFGTQC
jgi:hypothetical protein